MYKNASRFLQYRVEHAKDKPPEKLAGRSFRSSMERILKIGRIVQGEFIYLVPGGVIVYINQFRAFCPLSELKSADRTDFDFNRLIGRSAHFLVIKRNGTSAVVSRKKAIQIETWKRVEKAFATGAPMKGTVKEVKSYGAFVDLGEVDGLLHISKISAGWVANILSRITIGDQVEVLIIGVDKENNRISLSFHRKIEQPFKKHRKQV